MCGCQLFWLYTISDVMTGTMTCMVKAWHGMHVQKYCYPIDLIVHLLAASDTAAIFALHHVVWPCCNAPLVCWCIPFLCFQSSCTVASDTWRSIQVCCRLICAHLQSIRQCTVGVQLPRYAHHAAVVMRCVEMLHALWLPHDVAQWLA